MNNDLEQLSEEYLKELINSPADELTIALARIALAAKQAKPIGIFNQMIFDVAGSATVFSNKEALKAGFCSENGELTHNQKPLYTTPQPAHTEQDGWIKCSERMPENDSPVTTSNGVDVGKAWWDKDNWISWPQDTIYDEITHWMPLPAAPQPESEL